MDASLTNVNTSPGKAMPFKAWLVVGLLCVVGCLNYLDRNMITTMRGSIVTSIPMTDAQFGLLTSVFLWVYGFLSPIAGFLADRYSRSRVIIASLFIWSGVTFLTAHATSFQGLLVSRALMGISEACYLPAALALIADYHKGSTRSLAIGIHLAGVMIGSSLGFLGGWIAQDSHWNNAFTIFGGIGIVYSGILFFFLRDAKTKATTVDAGTDILKPKFFPALKDLFLKRSFIMLFIFWGLLGIVGWMIVGWLPTYYKEHFNISQAKAGAFATAYMYPFGMAGVIIGGILADWWSRKNANARILVPIIGLCAAAPAVFIAGSTSAIFLALAGFITYAFARVFSDTNLMPILTMVANKRYVATGYGVLNMFACVIGGLGNYATGVLRDQHVSMTLLFRMASVLMIVCVGLLYVVKKDVEKSAKAQ
ncbi:MFS transporter [Mucilaginibacter boryungensis]|nr:MFS transporter [Mucilaginibacter boryungensis]